MVVLDRRPTMTPVGIYLAADCVQDPGTGWQLCGLTVNPILTGQSPLLSFTVSQPSYTLGLVSNGFMAVALDPSGNVVLTWPPSGYVTAPGPGGSTSFLLSFIADQNVPSGLTGETLYVWAGAVDYLGDLTVGADANRDSNFMAGVQNDALLGAFATVDSGSGVSSGTPIGGGASPSTGGGVPTTPSSTPSTTPSTTTPSTTPSVPQTPAQSSGTQTKPPGGIGAWWAGLTSTDKFLVGAAGAATVAGVVVLATGRE